MNAVAEAGTLLPLDALVCPPIDHLIDCRDPLDGLHQQLSEFLATPRRRGRTKLWTAFWKAQAALQTTRSMLERVAATLLSEKERLLLNELWQTRQQLDQLITQTRIAADSAQTGYLRARAGLARRRARAHWRDARRAWVDTCAQHAQVQKAWLRLENTASRRMTPERWASVHARRQAFNAYRATAQQALASGSVTGPGTQARDKGGA